MNLNDKIPGAPNFAWKELIVTSRTEFAAKQTAGLQDGVIRSNLMSLASTILQPIRTYIGRALVISSGYRCPDLNAALAGSAANSQHMSGQAADFHVPGWTDAQLYALWEQLGWPSTSAPNLNVGQVIYEDNRPGRESGAWIHVSLGPPWRSSARSRQRLTYSPTTGWDQFTQVPPASHRKALIGG